MTTKTTKRALLMSALALFLCFSMLIGTTFAWFTDEVKSATNIIAAGNLDVELYNGLDTNAPKVGPTTSLFDEVTLWEPGVVAYENLTVENKGNLALKYQLAVNIVDLDGLKSLADVLKVAVVENGVQTDDRKELIASINNWMDFTSFVEAGELDEDETKTYGLVIWWEPSDKDNDYNMNNENQGQVLSAEIGIVLEATQLVAEEDSFGPEYDEDAWADGMQIYTADDLKDALANGETNIVLMDDITLDAPIVIPAAPTTYSLRTNAVVLNLNGKTISNPNDYVVENYGNVVITGKGTLTGMGIIRSHGGSIVIEDGNFYASSRWQDGVYQHTLKAENSVVTINGGNFDATVNGQTNAMLNASENAVITINGGSFKNVAGELTAFDPYIFTYEKNGAVVINDGTFYGGWRFNGETATTDIYGGIFTVGFDGQSFHANSTHVVTVYDGTFTAGTKLAEQLKKGIVAAGYKAVENNGKYVVVSETIDEENVVGTATELKTALSGAADAGSGNNTIFLAGDMDMTGTAWTPIKVDGYHGAGVITIEGNGATIKGLTAPLFAGGFAGKSGIIIKNLTIADSNIVSTSGLGGGAFVDTADSMQVVTLENCHLVNSTVTGERVGGLIGWVSGYANENDGPVKTYVTITNCSVVDSKVIGNGSAGAIAGHPGASDYTYTTIENCLVKGVDVISYEPVSSWRTGAIVGTANNGHVVINNVTVEDVTLTQDGVTAEKTMLYGRFVPATTGTLVIDGVYVLPAATTESLNNAIASGNTNVYLPAGEYKMPSSGNSNALVITGTKDTVVDVTLGAYMEAANVTFEGVTIKTGTGMVNGNGSDYAAFYSKDVTYKNCTFEGPMRVGRDGAKFIECTFNNLGNDYIWTYGNDVTFEGCTFNTDGKAILIYSDGGKEVSQVTVKNCVFNSTMGAKAGAIANQNCAAIEIHNYGNGVNLVTEGNTYDSNFSGEWRIKTYETGKTQVFVNGTEYTTIAIDGKIMTIDSNKNVTVNK